MTLQRQQDTPIGGVLLTKEGLDTAAAQLRLLEDYVSGVLREGQDYGVIPGTNDKPTLLKPGAANLIAAFNCYSDPHIETETVDLAEGLIFYRVRVDVLRQDNGTRRATGQGSCSSYEKKYRYRNALAVCLRCGKENVRISKGGGFYCWQRTGGCGANFHHDDIGITEQTSGQVINDDPMEQANTILKMAVKRAEVDAALRLPGVARFFTQDLEDMHPAVTDKADETPTLSTPASQTTPRAATQARTPETCALDGKMWAKGPGGRIGHPVGDNTWHWKDQATVPESEEVPPSNGGVPDFLDTPLGELQREVYEAEMGWADFEKYVLGMTWPEWLRLNGTVATARSQWKRLKQQVKEG